MPETELDSLKSAIHGIASEHGFADMRVADVSTSPFFAKFKQWIEEELYGDMGYLARNLALREFPQQLQEGTLRVLSFRYPYLPSQPGLCTPLENQDLANVSRYALGRDYHKFLRKKLQAVARQANDIVPFGYRVFVDSAPVLETAFAEKSGLGWKGKHTLLINQSEGSWFFLGEVFINLPIPTDDPVENQCGGCTACINICPTNAIVAPYKLDARRCISYLTIEHHGAIPLELRPMMGNHIYGCDDCQAICPWNRYTLTNRHDEFSARQQLDSASLLALWRWSEEDFLRKLEGSPIRRIGYQKWLRNLAVALGNSKPDPEKTQALESKKPEASEMVVEHIEWAIQQLQTRNSEPDIQQEQAHAIRQSTALKTRKLCQSIKKMTPQLS